MALNMFTMIISIFRAHLINTFISIRNLIIHLTLKNIELSRDESRRIDLY